MPSGKEYELAIKIAGKIDKSFDSAVSGAGGKLQGLGNALKNAGKIAATAMAAVGAAAAAVGTAAVKSAMEYESQLANVSTLLTGTEAEVAARTQEIGQQILDVSNRTGVVAENLTDGMYQVISAFGDSADAASQLEVAAKAAAAGNATTTDSINLLSAVTKGYGDTSAEAVQKAADLAFATVRLGQTSFPELAASMGKVIPLAGTLGVEQEQLFGAMSTLTGVTGSTSEVVTQLKAAMQGFMSPSKNMQTALAALGYESGQALLESEGLQGALNALKGAVGGDELAFAGLFSSVEAQTAVLSLAGTQADNFTQKTVGMYEAAGAAETAFARQTNTLEYTIQSFKNLGKNILIQAGTAMLPAVRQVTDALSRAGPTVERVFGLMSESITGILPTVEKLIPPIVEFSEQLISTFLPAFSDIAANILPQLFSLAQGLAPIFMQLVSAVLPPLLQLVQMLLPPLLTLIQSVMPVLASLTTTLEPLIQALMGALSPIIGLITQLIPPIAGIIAQLGPVIEYVGGVLTLLLNQLPPALTVVADVVGGVLSTALEGISPIVGNVMNIFNNLLGFFQNVFSSNWAGIWENVKNIFTNIFDAIANYLKIPINTILSVVNHMIGRINGLGITIPDWVPVLGGKSVSLNLPEIPMLAAGGIAAAPTMAMVGEGAEPEAILPLSKLANMLDGEMGQTFNSSESVSFSPVFNFYGPVDREAAVTAGRMSFEEFKRLYDEMRREEARKRL